MSRAHRGLRLIGVAVLVCALGAFYVAPANAGMSKAQKKAAAKKLIKQLKKNPRLIKSKRWLKRAGHVDARLPLTVRLNPVVDGDPAAGVQREIAASDDFAEIDLTSTFGPSIGGPKETTLSGVVNVEARFGNPAEGDSLGDVRLTVTGATLSAASVGVLDNPTAAVCSNGFLPNEPPVNPSTLISSTAGTSLGKTGGNVSEASLAPSVGPTTVVRTDPIEISAASITGAPNIGKANLFATTNNVRLSLRVNARINTIFRSLEDGTGGSSLSLSPQSLPGQIFHCDEAWAGTTTGPTSGSDSGNPVGQQNIIPVNVTGNLRINPAITSDGRLRIATVDVSSPEPLHATVDACLQVNSVIATTGGDPVNFPTQGFGSYQAEGTLNALSAGYSGPGTGPFFPTGTLVKTQAPTVLCDATYPTTANVQSTTWPLASDQDHTNLIYDPVVEEITGTASNGDSAKFLKLDPDVEVTGLTAEALIGTYSQ